MRDIVLVMKCNTHFEQRLVYEDYSTRLRAVSSPINLHYGVKNVTDMLQNSSVVKKKEETRKKTGLQGTSVHYCHYRTTSFEHPSI